MSVPVIAGVIAKIAGPLIARQLGKATADSVVTATVKEIVDKVTDDPVLKNEMNAEAPYQSRVVVGASAVIAGAGINMTPVGDALDVLAPIVVSIINFFGADLTPPEPGYFGKVIGAVMIVWGAGYTLYGRLASGLKPLFSR